VGEIGALFRGAKPTKPSHGDRTASKFRFINVKDTKGALQLN